MRSVRGAERSTGNPVQAVEDGGGAGLRRSTGDATT